MDYYYPRTPEPGPYRRNRMVDLTPAEVRHPELNRRVIIELSDDESEPEPQIMESPLGRTHHRRYSRDGYARARPRHIESDLPIHGERSSPSLSPQAHKRARTDANQNAIHDHTDFHRHHVHDHEQHGVPSSRTPPIVPVYSYIDGTGAHMHNQPNNFQRGNQGAPSHRPPKPQPAKESPEKPPYHVDGRFEAKMYNGPGYERFPVALGTVKGHQDICDKWDLEKTKKLEREAAKLQRTINTSYNIPDELDMLGEVDREPGAGREFEERCLKNVLEVFPDIEVAFVKKKIETSSAQEYPNPGDEVFEIEVTPLAEKIVAEILEMESYPKEDSSTSVSGPNAAPDDGTGITISWDRDLEKDAMYMKDAVILLAKSFDHVPTCYIHKIVEQKKSIFHAYVHIHGIEEQFYTLQKRPYPRLRQPRKDIEKKYLLTVTDRRIPYQYSHRINELQAARQHVAREAIQDAARKAKEEAEAANLLWHIENGALAECQCCFDAEIPLNRVVPCMADQQHYFCYGCVEGLADNQVGLMKYEMKCMDPTGCTADLVMEDVGKAVPILTFDRLEMNRQQAEIMAASIDGLEKCRWCAYQAICDTVETDPVFVCLNPECKRATCRKCNKDSHLPKTCEESKRDNDLGGRHRIEEARSEAIMRKCPNKKCAVKIIKEIGCNKMQCSSCQTKMCYVCNEDLTHLGTNPYWHFNKPGAKCPLYDQEGEDRHDAEALKAELEAIKEAKLVNAELDETQLRVESGKPQKSKLDDHPAAAAVYREMNNRRGRLDYRQRRVQELQERIAVMQTLVPDPQLEAVLAQINQQEQHRQRRVPMVHRQMMDLHHFDPYQQQAANVGNLMPPLPPLPPMPTMGAGNAPAVFPGYGAQFNPYQRIVERQLNYPASNEAWANPNNMQAPQYRGEGALFPGHVRHGAPAEYQVPNYGQQDPHFGVPFGMPPGYRRR
ncbi:hypothetical protein H2202_003252 [Exophiala xenobiotica]|nr:hypothetical protein H2202_003252 [Exophiala xenobiotica]KAK5210867.1 hypothetical protein LTR41_003479 [Exophiala xenobiotica]KAK5224804.1 hypothetical protein LTR72_004585 [Exophiala xenobiotica]KAK5237322.1 hypothetical protein LTR47_001588 [Exophiala xenobiotica]KAK5248446.1 hypothetical protein LTS06_006519 [Exophiala xenobiotica]